MIYSFDSYITFLIICAIITSASMAFWAVTNTMKKNNQQGEYDDANPVYMQTFEVTFERDYVPDNYYPPKES